MNEFFEGAAFDRKRPSAADQVLNDLRAMILSGRLARSERLPSEKELAAYYGVSAPTIREATRALSAIGLIEVRHGAGSFVVADASALMTAAMSAVVELEGIDLVSIIDLSESLWMQTVSLAIENPDIAAAEQLRLTALEFEKAMSNDEFETMLKSYLRQLAALSKNRLLEAMSTYVIDTQLSIARDVAARMPESWKRIAGNLTNERLVIAEAIIRGDRDAAVDGVRGYMGRARDLVRDNETMTPVSASMGERA